MASTLEASVSREKNYSIKSYQSAPTHSYCLQVSSYLAELIFILWVSVARHGSCSCSLYSWPKAQCTSLHIPGKSVSSPPPLFLFILLLCGCGCVVGWEEGKKWGRVSRLKILIIESLWLHILIIESLWLLNSFHPWDVYVLFPYINQSSRKIFLSSSRSFLHPFFVNIID